MATTCGCQLGFFKQAVLLLIVGALFLLVIYQLMDHQPSLIMRLPALTALMSGGQGRLQKPGGLNESKGLEDWRTMFYNVTAGEMQPLWKWPLEEDGRPAAVRNITVGFINPPYWLVASSWNNELKHRQCPVPCFFSRDPSVTSTADAVIVYAVGFPRQRPPARPPGQTWVFFILEAPPHGGGSNLDGPGWENQINWTMTYRDDSDLWFPYGRFHPRHDGGSANETNITGTERKMAAWVVSNCHAPSRRNEYVAKLQKHISVDIYGRCGSLTCGDKCAEVVGRSYRFYLAFENCFCQDYVTEKAFRYMAQAGVIPVVRGGANYTRFFPPGSYINTADFDSPKELGEHLKRVAASPTLQAPYFAWRSRLELEHYPSPACQLCVRLLRPQSFPRTYPAPWRWFSQTSHWSNVTQDLCRSAKDL